MKGLKKDNQIIINRKAKTVNELNNKPQKIITKKLSESAIVDDEVFIEDFLLDESYESLITSDQVQAVSLLESIGSSELTIHKERDMKGHQTPKKDNQILNRKSKTVNELNNKPLKIITKKIPESAIVEDEVAVEDYLFDESSESLVTSDLLQPVSSLESISSSELTPSSATSISKHVVCDTSAVHNTSIEPAYSSDTTNNVDEVTDMLVAHLQQAHTRVTNATGIDLSIKLVDKLTDLIVDEYVGEAYEKDLFEKLVDVKFSTLLLSFLPVFLCAVLNFCYREEISYSGPPPT